MTINTKLVWEEMSAWFEGEGDKGGDGEGDGDGDGGAFGEEMLERDEDYCRECGARLARPYYRRPLDLTCRVL